MEFQTTSYGVATVKQTTYADGNLAILLVDDMGSPLCKLSVNFPEDIDMLDENQFFAKTYAENRELAKDALQSGLFKETEKFIDNGYVKCPVWEIVIP